MLLLCVVVVGGGTVQPSLPRANQQTSSSQANFMTGHGECVKWRIHVSRTFSSWVLGGGYFPKKVGSKNFAFIQSLEYDV